MKRSRPLKRRKPMRRAGFKSKPLGQLRKSPLKQKKRLSPVSKTQAYWNALYRKQCEIDWSIQTCAATGLKFRKEMLDRHHVARRKGNRILIYVYICRGHHLFIENNTKDARRIGWLRNEALGYPKDPMQPRPWFNGTCINEHLLDE